MNIFEALREDHDVQRRLLQLLVATEGNSQGRKELFDRAQDALRHHAAAEERHFYVPLMEFDLTQGLARHSVAEHQEIDELIRTLETTDPSSPGWLAHARKLRETVTHHLDEEEHEVFQQAGRALEEVSKQRLAEAYRQEMQALQSD